MKKISIIILGVLVIIFAAVFIIKPNPPVTTKPVTSFEECVAAGNPVMESYPEQCRTKEGELFVRKVNG